MSLIRDVARTAHEVNRAYCKSLGDNSQPPWEETSEEHRRSLYVGVRGHVTGSFKTPGDAHRSWLEVKEREGWSYGPVKDVAKKLHPCFRPFEELSEEQQLKDILCGAVSRSSGRLMAASEVIFSFKSALCRELLELAIVDELWNVRPDTAFTDPLQKVVREALEVLSGKD